MGNLGKLLVLQVLWCLLFTGEAAEYVKYKDPKQPINMRIRDLLGRMTLEEKLGQMALIATQAISPYNVTKYHVGNVFLYPGGPPAPNASAKVWMDFADSYMKSALSDRLGIPIIIGVDAVHGHNNFYGATIFPHNIGLGATRDPELVKQIGAATATEVRATGISYSFAPSIAVCRNPRWGRCYESFSEDPEVVRSMTEIIPGLQGDLPPGYRNNTPYVDYKSNKIAGCAKHFVGDGGTVDGIDKNNTIIDWKGLRKIHMAGYIDSVAKGVATIMISYSSWNGVKMHAHYDLITGYLKDKLKFKGFVTSDSGGVDLMTTPPGANYSNSVRIAINAGIDMVLVPYTYEKYLQVLTKLVNEKAIPMTRIDDAVTRVLRVKFIMGLFENPYGNRTLLNQIGIKKHRELAREAVRKSLVLLKNGKSMSSPLLPLPKKAGKILVAGTHADNIGLQCGGWTISGQGESGNIQIGTTILGAVKQTVDKETEVVYIENPGKDVVASSGFSYAIVVVGELPYAEVDGDSKDLRMNTTDYKQIINVCGGSVKCVVIVISGRPIVMEPYLKRIDALVAAWLPGTEGQGVADVLFGDYGFSGKLPRTWFRRVDQLPMNVGDKDYDPLFPYGFGLTTKPNAG